MANRIRQSKRQCPVIAITSIAGAGAFSPIGWRCCGRDIADNRPTVLTPKMEARILEKTRQAPPDGSTHWSTRKLGSVLKIHHNLAAKAWQRAGLQPHRLEIVKTAHSPIEPRLLFEIETAV
jgi:hypothetical protein